MTKRRDSVALLVLMGAMGGCGPKPHVVDPQPKTEPLLCDPAHPFNKAIKAEPLVYPQANVRGLRGRQGAAPPMGPHAPLGAAAPTSAQPLVSVVFPLGGCPPWGCGGSNSPWMGRNIVFHDVDSSMKEANDAGLILVSFVSKDNVELKLDVEGDHLRGVLPNGNLLADLKGARIRLRHESAERGVQFYVLCVVDVKEDATNFWAGPADSVPAYYFSFRNEAETDLWRPLCAPNVREFDNIEEVIALVFEGDRYGAAKKTVTDETTPTMTPWFNIACADTAVSKMHLLRHTAAGSIPANSTTCTGPTPPKICTDPAERQAMLKMLAADYCGTGEAFTRKGQPLSYAFSKPTWTNSGTSDTNPGRPKSIEAIWDENGALCVETPRLEGADFIDANNDGTIDKTPDGPDDDKFTETKRSACKGGMPTCRKWLAENQLGQLEALPWPKSGDPWIGLGGSYIISGNPKPKNPNSPTP